MNGARQGFLLILTSVYIAINVLFWGAGDLLAKHGADRNILLIANSIIFLMSFAAFLAQQKALNDKNPNVFIRSVMATMMVRMLVCVLAVLVYKFLSADAFSNNAVFISLFLYLVYLAIEVYAIMKLNKNKNG
jgi:predicted neutral ceramidase superfamily lipid hydrolase